MNEKRKIHLPTGNQQRIQLAPGVTLVLEGARLRGHTTAVLPPGAYSVEVNCELLGIATGSPFARAEARFVIAVEPETQEGGEG